MFSPIALANSCLNVGIEGLMDEQVFQITGDEVHAVGTFRIESERVEDLQPAFNLVRISCDGLASVQDGQITCTVADARILAESNSPNAKTTNCDLSLKTYTIHMKKAANGVLQYTGLDGLCYNETITIDTKAERIFRTYTKNANAYSDAAKALNVCNRTPPTQTLMNCTSWAAKRAGREEGTRYYDFGGVKTRSASPQK